MSDVYPTQQYVDEKDLLKKIGDTHDPKGILDGNKLYLLDGHHRVAGDIMDGKKKTPIKYITLEHLQKLLKLNEIASYSDRTPLRVDQYGKDIVWEDGDYYVSVNDLNDATYITAWDNSKRVGEMWLTPGRNSGLNGYIAVQNIEILPKYRGNGLGYQMYKAALKYSSDKYKGIGGENKQRSNNKQVPAIYRKLGGIKLDDGSYIVNRD